MLICIDPRPWCSNTKSIPLAGIKWMRAANVHVTRLSDLGNVYVADRGHPRIIKLAPPALIAPPTGYTTGVPLTGSGIPSFVPTPDPLTGGQVVTVAAGATGGAIIDRAANSPFPMTLEVPAGSGDTTVRVQPATNLDDPSKLPGGVTVAKVVKINMYGNDGKLIHDHSRRRCSRFS